MRCDNYAERSNGDRPTKLSQIFKISMRGSKLWALGTVDELTWPHTMRSSAPRVATADALKRSDFSPCLSADPAPRDGPRTDGPWLACGMGKIRTDGRGAA